ncbi:InlB B-repeat-containing protein [Heliophilum fasciatum]|uniref:Putative repeat protein (TIGR02543 family) n=1 Tax=Heliophilum fasciatum TaxID=35700 RepID=A0A4R2RYH3_9FIRM|nr:InlB B-repeat-containing protein [Heliophilum fasciatum]MCW2277247.1 putative repeat protein (TIGR02543 family) [Heliophilum fasciatum]TCP68119.1 putative repeat protein (TIGR02543 family) [Heliophilum fasciatum]
MNRTVLKQSTKHRADHQETAGAMRAGIFRCKKISLLLTLMILVNLVPLGVFAASAASATLTGTVTIPQAVPDGQKVIIELSANHDMGSTEVILNPGQTTASYVITLNLADHQDTYLRYSITDSGGIDMVSSGIYKNDAGHSICYSESEISAMFDPISAGQTIIADFAVPLGYPIQGTIFLPEEEVAPEGGLQYQITSGLGVTLPAKVMAQGSSSATYRIVMPPSATSTVGCILSNQDRYCKANYYSPEGTAPHYNGGKVLNIANPLSNVDIQLISAYLISGKVYLPSGISNTGVTTATSAIIATGPSYSLTGEACFPPGAEFSTYQLLVPRNFNVQTLMANAPTGGTIAGMFMPSYYSTDALSTMWPGATGFSVTDNMTKNIAIILYPATTAVVPVTTHTVTYDRNGGDTDANPVSHSVVSGSAVGSLPTAPTRSGYSFTGWNTVSNGSGSEFTAGTAVSQNTTVYAQWSVEPVQTYTVTYDRNGGDTDADPVSHSVISGSTVESLPTAPTRSGYSFTGWNTVSNGSGSVFTHATVVLADLKVYAQWTFNRRDGGGKARQPAAPVSNINSGASLAQADMKQLASMGSTLTVNSQDGSRLVFDAEAVKGIANQAGSSVQATMQNVSAQYQTSHPGRVVYSLTVTSEGKTISQFGGSVTVTLPYTLKPGEDPSRVAIWHLAADGILTEIPCSYDVATGRVTFKVSHFALYMIGLNQATGQPAAGTRSKSFADMKADEWFSGAVQYMTDRGLMEGTDANSFGPQGDVTRAMIVTILWRMEGKPAPASSAAFADVPAGEYYTQAVAWAAKEGIVKGHSADRFAPQQSITREQLVAMLFRYAQYKKQDTSQGSMSSREYADYGNISEYAAPAVAWAVHKGLLLGSDNQLLPGGNTTRAQVAALLQRFDESHRLEP